MNRLCVINQIEVDIKENIIGVGRTSAKQLEKENQILLPIGGTDGKKLYTQDTTVEWAKKLQTTINEKYQSQHYGNLLDIDSTRADGTVVTIIVPTALVDAYEKKENDKRIRLSTFNRDTVDKNIKEKYFEKSNKTTSVEILRKIANSPHRLSRVAEKLISYAKNNNVTITLDTNPTVDNNVPAGSYLHATNDITIRENAEFRGLGSEPTIIHEILHSLTAQQLRDNSEVSKHFNDLFEYTKSKINKGQYALNDVDEFIVALFTDAYFIKELQSIRSMDTEKKYNNLFEEIFDYILKIFNFNKSEELTMYEDAFSTATHILENFRESKEELGKTNEFFQLTNDTVNKKNELIDQINTLLEDYIKANNIKVEFLESLRDEYSNDPVAVFDAVNNVIKININKADISTLPEELGHHISLALGTDHTLIKRALNLIGRTNYKEILGQAYINEYKGDTEALKLEYLGKLISQQIRNKSLPNELNSENGNKIWETIKNIINAFIKLFKPNTNIEESLDKLTGELANMVLQGTKVGTAKTNIKKMFQLDDKGTFMILNGFPMNPASLSKVNNGTKSYSVRPNNYKTGVYKIGKFHYNITNVYGKKVNISDIQDPVELKKLSVGDDKIRYENISEFFNGQGELFVYKIEKVDDKLQKIINDATGETLKSQMVADYGKQIAYYKKKMKELLTKNKSLDPDSDEYIENVNKANLIDASIKDLLASGNKQTLINLANESIDLMSDKIDALEKDVQQNKALNYSDIDEILKALQILSEFSPTSGRALDLIVHLKPYIKNYIMTEINRFSTDKIDESVLEKVDKDIFIGEANFGTLSDVQDYLAKTIGYLIKEAQAKIERENKDSYNGLNEEIKKLKEYSNTNGIKTDDMYKIFIQTYSTRAKDGRTRTTTVLTKPYTTEFYDELNKSRGMTAEEGKAYRKTIATYDDTEGAEEKWIPKNKAKYSNPDYAKIQSTPELRSFYNYFKKSVKESSKNLPVSLNANFIPNIVNRSLKDIMKSDKKLLAKLKDGVEHILGANDWNIDNNNFIQDESLQEDEVPLEYMGSLNPNVKSGDLGTVLLKYMYFSNSYNHMSEILPKTRLLQEIITDKKYISNSGKKTIEGSKTNVNSIVESYINMQVKGEMKKDEAYAPAIDTLLNYTSLLRIGLNPFNALANIFIGNIGNTIEAIGGRFFNLKELTEAIGIFTKDGFNSESKLGKLTELYNPLMEMEDYEHLSKIVIGSSEYKEKIKALMYAPQRLGEKQMQTSTMIAILKHDKIETKDGSKISVWDAFNEDGTWNEQLVGYPLTEAMIFKTTNKIHRVNQMTHGRYSSKDAARLQQFALFRAAFQFKKWIPAAIEARIGSKRFDDRLGVEIEGRYHTYIKFIQATFARLSNDIEKIEQYKFNETDIYNMRKNTVELVILLSLTLLGAGDDDKELKKNPYYKFAMRQLDTVSGDMLFWYSPAKLNEQTTNGLPMSKTLKDLFQVVTMMPQALGGKGSVYTKGRYKGENKELAAIINTLPIVKPIADVVRLYNKDPYQNK